MTKTLSVSIESTDKDTNLSISGTRNENKFNEVVVLSIGQQRIPVNSRELAEALKAVVDFVTPPAASLTSEVAS